MPSWGLPVLARWERKKIVAMVVATEIGGFSEDGSVSWRVLVYCSRFANNEQMFTSAV